MTDRIQLGTMEQPQFSPAAMALVQKIIKRYPEGRHKSALLPILHIAQAEFGGWLSPSTMDYVASILNIKPIEVYEVASFYTMYNMRPVGKCVLEVCRTGPCALRGSDDIIEYLENKLGIKEGETTADGMFTLKAVECLASCGSAPMMQVGNHYIENLSVEKMDEVLDQLKTRHNVPNPDYGSPYPVSPENNG
ncbi:NADH-quinone oxidoreductase subunit NuoE family protein [Chryseosolibacter indicus]|uniref:NADH-quinone oxidoreductase subunit NuoE family protein n=1 Tax=Chryseosolibacter indicus TaxID=2782351 RepID=UPI003F58E83B